MTLLSVRLRHRFARGPALNMAFEAPLPGVVAVFGPSGAGKSSLLAAIAGLLRADHAEIALGGTVLEAPGRALPPERRRIGLVFQEARLFPHLNVAANLRYGAKRRGRRDAAGARRHLDEVVALLDLERLLGRHPRSLSGGEGQRVAIGRALLSDPALLALDEPLAALDAPRRAEILPYLARLRRSGLPMLYVTHAAQEVAQLADTLLLVEAGRVRACGPVAELLAAGTPGFGRTTLLHGHVVTPGESMARVLAEGWDLPLPGPLPGSPLTGPRPGPSRDAWRAGARVRLLIAARNVMLLPHATAGAVAAVAVAEIAPGLVAVRPEADATARPLLALLPPGAAAPPGTRLSAMVNPHAIGAFNVAP